MKFLWIILFCLPLQLWAHGGEDHGEEEQKTTAAMPASSGSRAYASSELFELVLEEVRASGLEEQIAAGVVLTGGTAKMEGAIEFAEDIFQMPVRLGYPTKIKGLAEYVQDPAYASVVGLLLYGKDVRQQQKKAGAARESVGGLVRKITSWFKGEF